MPSPKNVDDTVGLYANFLAVGQNEFEFVLDFAQMYPGQEQPRVVVRIITGPAYAKSISDALQDAVRRHEEEFGELPSD